MADAMKGVTRVMGRMNRAMNLPQLQRIMMEFERQNEALGMKVLTSFMGVSLSSYSSERNDG